MGTRNSSSFQTHDYFYRLSKALEFAVSEWLLMFLLFIDACFAYLIAKFASYCHLQGPCLMCSRYDHVLAKDKKGIYWDSICNHHKSEISSVVLCHVHDQLLVVHGICENCLSSCVAKTKNKFNAETFRLLVGKMGSNPSLEDCSHGASDSRICFCCNEQYVSRDYDKNLLPDSSIHSDDYVPLFDDGEHSKNEKNIFVDDSLEQFTSSHMGQNHISPPSESDHQKVDVNSDSDSELLVSDDKNAPALIPEVPLKPVTQSEVLNDPATVAPSDTGRNDAKTPADGFLETTDVPRTGELMKDPVTESESTTTNGHQTSNNLELGDAYKIAISSEGRNLSGKLLDQKSFKESSTRVGEDIKLLLSHRSNDNLISPKLSFNSDELTGMQFLQRRISLERNESNLSLDGSIVSEIDGETVVDRLRRQVEHDKKVIAVLYKELEEERNASAVATNQAMAMITRLQEEKAALFTEASQCLRMMEEQAEYNSEALQNANDVIEEKDKQIQDLEELLRKTSEEVTP